MKKIMSFVIVLTMVVTLVGCAKEEQPVEATETLIETTEVSTTVKIQEEAVVKEATVTAPAFDNQHPEFILGETETTVSYKNKFGAEVTITKQPKKVVVLYNSLLGLWYYMGGESLTKVKGSSNVPEVAKELDDLGSSYSVSLEAIISYEPELVIISGNIDAQVVMIPSLNEMGIETMIIDAKTKSYERFSENAYLFSKVLGTESLYAEKMEKVIGDVEAIISMTTEVESGPRVASIFATSKSMALETELAQIGEIVSLLGGKNIYDETDVMAEGETRIPFSIEALVTQNPEVILIATMGSIESAEATIGEMIKENPVWHEVDAVKNERVYYLDKELSIYKPNQRYAEAFEMVAMYLYPKLFGGE